MKKSNGFLKFIVAYKAIFSIAELGISASFFHFIGKNLALEVTHLAVNLNLDMENRVVHSVIEQAGVMGEGTMMGITVFVFFLGVLNMIEAIGLYMRQRWAEWLTVFATGALIPLEAYEVYSHVTSLRVAILIINVLVVYYLAKHKELFNESHLPGFVRKYLPKKRKNHKLRVKMD